MRTIEPLGILLYDTAQYQTYSTISYDTKTYRFSDICVFGYYTYDVIENLSQQDKKFDIVGVMFNEHFFQMYIKRLTKVNPPYSQFQSNPLFFVECATSANPLINSNLLVRSL